MHCEWCGTNRDGRSLKQIGVRDDNHTLEWNKVCRDCYEQEMGNREVDIKIREEMILSIYNTGENPLSYVIEPKLSIKITDKNDETKKEDLERVL